MDLASVGEGAQGVVASGPLVLAVLVAAAAGVLSFFSPCVLPLVPGYLSYVAGVAGSDGARRDAAQPAAGSTAQPEPAVAAAGAGRRAAPATPRTGSAGPPREAPVRRRAGSGTRSRTVLGALLFVAGFAVVFTSYGALFGAVGSLLVSYQEWLVRGLGALTILLGLVFTGLFWRVPWTGRDLRVRYRPRVGLIGAPLLGATFGLGWTPCIGPTLAAVLTLATSQADAGRGALLSLVYSLGLGIPFIVAAVSVQRVMTRFAWARRHAPAVMRVGGAMLVVLGVLLVTGVWTQLMAQIQGLVGTWQPPL